MEKPPLRKYYDKVRFVFLTSFVCFVSLLLLNYYMAVSDRGITFLLFNMNDNAKLAHMPKPSNSLNFNETSIGFGKTNYTNQNNVTNVPNKPSGTIVENHTETIVHWRDHMSSPPLVRDNAGYVTNMPTRNLDSCSGKYIYVHDLPSRFNLDLLKGCHNLMKWFDMCPYVSNLGLGPKVVEKSRERVLSEGSWYATNQFSLEVIFHNTVKHYKCLTNDSSLASAIYVPYYAGLDVGQYLWGFNVSMRDDSPKELVKWLAQRPEWKRMWGRDHFIVGGRIGWDFRRKTEDNDDWGTKLMFLPEASNMSILLIESAIDSNANEFAIPYPTYFHPSKDKEIFQWQKKMIIVKRPYLFSFAGAPRPNANASSSIIRNEIIKQCQFSRSCKLLGCYGGHHNHCNDPVSVTKVFQSSVFCLQPIGDSFTRRSTFDSILAGCIPVFFHPNSAYNQYFWHFPKNGSSYSVYIPESDVTQKRVMINEALSKVPKHEVLAMRKEVIRLIPRIIYRYPSSRLETVEDAFDIAVKGILGRIEATRRDIANVNYPEVGPKYNYQVR